VASATGTCVAAAKSSPNRGRFLYCATRDAGPNPVRGASPSVTTILASPLLVFFPLPTPPELGAVQRAAHVLGFGGL
jgi:hypothetical protein